MKRYRWIFWLALGMWLYAASCGENSGSVREVDCGECPTGWRCDSERGCRPECLKNPDCGEELFCVEGVCTASVPYYPVDAFPDGDDDAIEVEPTPERDPDEPWMVVSPTLLDFGAVNHGGSATADLLINNYGGGALEISRWELSDGAQGVEILEETPLTIEPSGEISISVLYRPSTFDNLDAEWTLFTNDPVLPEVVVRLRSLVKQVPIIAVLPDPLDFGTVRAEEAEFAFTLENQGGSGLVVFQIKLENAGNSGFELPFELQSVNQSNPLEIEAFDSIDTRLWFHPEEPGFYSDNLILQSNDENNHRLIVPVSVTVCEPEIDVVPLVLDFSTVPAGQSEMRSTVVTNLGCWPLDLQVAMSEELTTESFTWDETPPESAVLEENQSLELKVRYDPGENLDDDTGAILLTTNDTDEAEVVVVFSAHSVPPDVEVTPEELRWNSNASIKELRIRNMGAGLLELRNFSIVIDQGSENAFYLTDLPPVSHLGPGQALTLSVGYSPRTENEDLGRLRFSTNDPDETLVEIPLSGDGFNLCPVADAGEGYQVAPLETIILDATNSHDPDGEVMRYHWEVITRPPGSRSQPLTLLDARPSFFFDLAGYYVFRLRVQDDDLAWSCDPEFSEVMFRAIPDEKIHIQLTWDTNNTDLDLHLIRPAGELWNTDFPDDCYYATCVPTEENPDPVDWYVFGQPSLDIDDRDGYGPENINLDDATDIGDFEVYVHFWDDCYNPNRPCVDDEDPPRQTTATVRIFINGSQEHAESVTFTDEHFRWHVCDIRWLLGSAAIVNTSTEIVEDRHGN